MILSAGGAKEQSTKSCRGKCGKDDISRGDSGGGNKIDTCSGNNNCNDNSNGNGDGDGDSSNGDSRDKDHAESIMLSAGGADSIILSASNSESMIISGDAESIILSALSLKP
jgi:hypothetical protein